MFWNALALGLSAIRRNLLRSFLTILGIVIGVAAVIVIVTLGSGAPPVQAVPNRLGTDPLPTPTVSAPAPEPTPSIETRRAGQDICS